MTYVIQNRVIRTGDTMTGNLSLLTNTLTAGAALIGTNPASAGSVRIPNNSWIAARNAANSANVNMISVNTSDQVAVGTIKAITSSAYTPSNVSTDRSYNANSTTIDELADVLGTVIADLQTAGILG